MSLALDMLDYWTMTANRAGVPWETGRSARLLMGAALLVLAGMMSPSPARAADFNGDGRSDILWQHPSGLVRVWLLDGARVVGTGTAGVVSRGWGIGTVGDFNGDGRSDILWRHLSGILRIWFMNGRRVIAQASPGTVTGEWQIAAVGDFNGDRRSDILWRHTISGAVVIWFMTGAHATAGYLGVVSPEWQIAGVGDFNGDRRADLLWQHPSGSVSIWLMNGLRVIGSGGTTGVPRAWRVAATGDVNGDGRDDLLWQDLDGRLSVWFLASAQLVGGVSLGPVPGEWQLAGAGDFNGDGRFDLLLRRPTGELRLWLLGQAGVIGQADLGLAGPAWRVREDQPSPFVGFTATFAPLPPLTSTVADVDEDGWVEPLGTINRGQGNLDVVSLWTTGLGALFANGRKHRDTRLADLDGDGHLDLIANTYAPVTDANSMALLFHGNGDGTFTEDPRFRTLNDGLGIRGFGETILVADFNNDGFLDLFIPYYTFNDPSEHCYLLINNGHGGFVDVSDRAGVSLRGRPHALRPEGAQAVDFDGDGWIDIYVAGHLFINNGNLTFTDRRAALGLPELFDEGAKFLDWNNDGRLDLLLHHPQRGPRLFEFDRIASVFRERNAFGGASYEAGPDTAAEPGAAPQAEVGRLETFSEDSFGVNVHDVDNDGREDIVTVGGRACNTILYLNTGIGFRQAWTGDLEPLCVGTGAPAFADLDGDGRIDVTFVEFGRTGTRLAALLNQSRSGAGWLRIEVLGSQGQQNQHGRVVGVSPVSRPNVIMTRVVDGGSGYLSQGQYPLLVGTPYAGPHRVAVRFADRLFTFDMQPGQTARVFADGRVEVDGAAP